MMPRRFAAAAALAPWMAVLVVAGCGFFDPLDQSGLGLRVSPPDTALYVGAQARARGLMVNTYGDAYPSTHIRYAGLDAAASVTEDGTITGLTYGRARVVAARGPFADTGWVSVVPEGRLALSLMSDRSTVDIMNADGSGFTSLVSSGQFTGGAPAWLPGDAGLVYQYAIPGGAGGTRLYVTDLAGNARMLVPFGRDPRVARDGSWVYFTYVVNGNEIWRVRPDGSGLTQVTVSPNSFVGDSYPDPSPDGTELVFVSTRFPGGGLQLAVRDLAGGAERLLGTEGLLPRWAPGGDSIAYWGGDAFTLRGAIFVIGTDGTGARQVSAAGRVYPPSGLDWSPDGRWLLARSGSTIDMIEVATGLTLPLGYSGDYHLASWRW